MKRWIAIFLALVGIFALFGCSAEEKGSDAPKFYFTAEVVQENENTYLIEITDKENSGITPGEQTYLTKAEVTGSGITQLAKGDVVRVVFDGNVMETYPLQLGEVYSVALLHTEE